MSKNKKSEKGCAVSAQHGKTGKIDYIYPWIIPTSSGPRGLVSGNRENCDFSQKNCV